MVKKKRPAPKKKAVAKKKVASKRTSVKTKKSSKKSSPKKRASSASSRKKPEKKPAKAIEQVSLHKDGSENVKHSSELLAHIPNIMGRPTKYTKVITKQICWLISLGYSLNKICMYADMPCMTTVFDWLNDPGKKEFSDKYTHARAMRTETIEDSLMDIADDASNPLMIGGELVIVDGKPVMVTDNAAVQHARLRIDTRTRHMEVKKPKEWGKALDVVGTGETLLQMMGLGAGRLAALEDRRNGKEEDLKTFEIVDGEVVEVGK